MTIDDYAAAIAAGTLVTRKMVEDGLVEREALELDPLWDCDFITDDWFKRTPEFFAARNDAAQRASDELPLAELALASVLGTMRRDLPPQEDGPAGPLAPNGVEYAEVTAGIAPPGEIPSVVNETYNAAIEEWRQRLMQFAAINLGDVLWWRVRPEICSRLWFGETRVFWCIYSRLMIGNKGVIDEKIARHYAEIAGSIG